MKKGDHLLRVALCRGVRYIDEQSVLGDLLEGGLT